MARYIYSNFWKDGNGKVVASGTVSVYLAGTTTAANVYTTETGTSAVSSVTSSSTDGSFTFYTDDSDYDSTQKYDITLSKAEFTSKTIYGVQPTVVIGSYTISTAKTVSTKVFVPEGVVYTKSGSGTMAFTGKFEAGRYQVFSGFNAGDVTFSAGVADAIYPEWWGENTTPGTTEMSTEINSAIQSIKAASVGGVVDFATYNYYITSAITLAKTAADTTYDNITLRGSGMGSKITLGDTTAAPGVDAAIYAYSSSTSPLRGLRIENLYIDAGCSARVGGGGGTDHFGIHALHVYNSVIRNNYITRSGASGIFVGRWSSDNTKYAYNVLVDGNTVDTCYGDGIYGMWTKSCRFVNNHVQDNGTDTETYAFTMEGIYDSVVANNTVEDVTNGILINNSTTTNPCYTTVSGNTIKSSDLYGIYVCNSYWVTVTGNVIDSTGTTADHNGIMVHDGVEGALTTVGPQNGNTITGNVVSRSGGNGIAVSTSSNIIANNVLINNNTSNTANISGVGLFNNAGGTTYPCFNQICGNLAINTQLNEESLVDGLTNYAIYIPTGAIGNYVHNNMGQLMAGGLISDNGTNTSLRGNYNGAITNAVSWTASGTNLGTVSLVAGSTTVSTKQVVAGDKIHLARVVAGGTLGHLSVGTISAATSFVINSSSNTETSTIFWEIVH